MIRVLRRLPLLSTTHFTVSKKYPHSSLIPKRTMKLPPSFLGLALACFTVAARAEVVAGHYDMASVRDASTLETRAIEDWHPWAKDAGIRQKLIEITVC